MALYGVSMQGLSGARLGRGEAWRGRAEARHSATKHSKGEVAHRRA